MNLDYSDVCLEQESKSTSEWFLEWPSQTPDLKPAKMLWNDFKHPLM